MFLTLVKGFSQQDQNKLLQLKGKWMGTVESLRVVFTISSQNDSVIVMLDSPDQGVMGIPVDGYSFIHDTVYFDVRSIGGKYTGTWNAESNIIDGIWYQGGFEFPLELNLNETYEGLNRPQEPKPPYPYLVEDVTFLNDKAGVTLAGTLTLPKENQLSAAAILVTGSGGQNRDEEILGHKPFLVIANYLTRIGIAVLRYDDRGIGKSTGDIMTATTWDFATDAASAFEFLKEDPRIDPKRIGIIGHSEGAMIAPIVASEYPDLAYIVMLAGSGLSGEDLLFVQSEKLLNASGESEENIRKVIDFNHKVYKIAISADDKDRAEKKLRKAFAKFTKNMTETEKARMGFSDYMVNTTISQVLNPWMRYFLKLDIRTYLSETKCPVLIMSGDKDLQTPPKENVPPIEAALKQGGNTDYKVVILPNLNHLFQTCETGSPQEYARISETFSPKALDIIGEWIKYAIRNN
jgi:pimeloyl-ACP methyl ester carboxylesterase